MNTPYITAVIALVYVSIVIEIVFFPVPSVASTYRLFSRDRLQINSKEMIGRVSRFSFPKKVLLLLIPAVLGVTAFCIPLVVALFPRLNSYLIPLTILEHDLARLSGVILMVTGRGISFRAVFWIRKSGCLEGNNISLITEGVFRISRNPIVLGMLLTFLGFFLVFPSLILFIGFLVFAGNMHMKIVLEEGYLKQAFSKRYEYYMNRTGRYI